MERTDNPKGNEMFHKIREAQMGDRDEGFTLIELLVVVIIIGILAAIAIPVFLNQRQKAWQKAATSDARNAAIEVESYYADNNEYPANDAAFQALDIEESANVTLTYVGNDTQESFCIEANHSQLDPDPDALYDSGAGGIQDDPSASCSNGL